MAKVTDHIQNLDDGRRVMALAAKVQNVLRTYEQELTVARVDHLAESITACYQELVHKGELGKSCRSGSRNSLDYPLRR